LPDAQIKTANTSWLRVESCVEGERRNKTLLLFLSEHRKR
jgi:hypothetical protein